MPGAPPNEITRLLDQFRQGDPGAREKLAELVYPELKRLSADRLRRERPNHTLQPTALANEAFLRLVQAGRIDWHDRNHFFAVSSELIRQILVDYARRRGAVKRGGGAIPLTIEEWQAGFEEHPDRIIDIDRLITRLASLDPRQAHIVELRFFSGLTEKEIAEILGISERSVKREWQSARAWLHKELSA